MRRPATMTHRQKQNAYHGSQPLLPDNRKQQTQRAFDAATEFFKKYKSPLTDTLQDIFGTRFFGRAALWLDPLSQFRNTAGIFCYANRTRDKFAFTHNGTVVDRYRATTGKNYDLETPNVFYDFDDFVTGESETSIINDDQTRMTSFMRDSTRKSRSWDQSYTFNDEYDPDSPSYGEMEMDHYEDEIVSDANAVKRSVVTNTHLGLEGTPQYLFYSRDIETNVCFVGGSCTSVSGSLFVTDIDVIAQQLMNDNVSSLISQAVASRRTFNAWYQVSELRDIPKIVGNLVDLQLLLKKYAKNPLLTLKSLDKDISKLYLGWEFGVVSTYSAFKGLMKLPEKTVKKLNYLIRRNGKVSTGRSKRIVVDDPPDQELPTFEFHLPNWITVSDEEVTRTWSYELRCVVNQTIQFPQLAVPSITDSDYRKLIGATPTPEDLYNVIPFSWLVDYFVGVGDYVGVLSAVHSDTQLINFGFMTIVIAEKLEHKATLEVTSRIDHSVIGYGLVSSESQTRKVPYLKTYTRKYQHRVNIGDLDGVKSIGFFGTNLSDFQLSILGSLFSQRRKR